MSSALIKWLDDSKVQKPSPLTQGRANFAVIQTPELSEIRLKLDLAKPTPLLSFFPCPNLASSLFISFSSNTSSVNHLHKGSHLRLCFRKSDLKHGSSALTSMTNWLFLLLKPGNLLVQKWHSSFHIQYLVQCLMDDKHLKRKVCKFEIISKYIYFISLFSSYNKQISPRKRKRYTL